MLCLLQEGDKRKHEHRVVYWLSEIKEKIRLRRQVYKEISSGREDKWGEYYKLHSEMKELVCKKKLYSWNDKANKDFYENRKEFWAFVGRTSKGSRKGIASLRSTSGSCVTSTKGKLEVLHEHYERLGTASVDDQFDDSWKEHIEKKVTEYSKYLVCRRIRFWIEGLVMHKLKSVLKA